MIKALIKKICYKIVEIGNFEQLRRKDLERNEQINKIADIGESVHISEEATIYNNSNPKDKIKIANRSRVMGHLFIFDHNGEILIGEDCFVGPDTRIWSAKKVSIGNRVLIAHNVNIHDNISHPIDASERHKEFIDFVETGVHQYTDLKPAEIIIEDDVWIGFNSIILKGVTIGRGAIIGAGSVVTKDVEPWTVNVGNPLRCIQKLTPPANF